MSAGRGNNAANHSAARTLATVMGAPLAACAVGAAVMAFLPVSGPWAFALGFHVVLPVWVGFACALPLARNGRVAWGVCLAVVVPVAVALAVRGPR
ncbi:hypothetical protein D7Y27_12060 [Corallococcus sp. AB004]|uniref:hypothetical protein n=1 Tax=Corallococcus TaxID=83461 RepID=UPI000EA092E8|nr:MULTISPECIES: hypothetical protein [Corallococcus]NPD27984.1 hypothetical protein [Corallococcus exiguus]NRD48424.1 hypothetical protein [Corallococcus exiguus]RKH95632.1 hypothetical protein D7Y04_31985 [Corallococcus sp. AB038B]RKI44884.1 hypothetical protein D7Y27_12060 [Corallococcus sp. AB004]